MTEVKERLMHTKKKLMFNNDDEGHVTEEPTSKVAMKHVDARGPVARQIGFQESGGSKETVNAYEQRRNEIVASNKAKMRELGLGQSKSDGRKENREKTPRINEDASESDYVPDNDEHAQLEQSDDDLDNIVTSKVPPVEPIHKDAPLLTAKEKLQNLRNGPGSMASYNELREREKQLLEKQQLEKEIPEGESATQQVISQSESGKKEL
ncbi:hypothetical protein DCAR_0311580 [Daucus carota subsp. sativus]|uniref:Uncharacterized protein n=1 Tax=Daucus carota subsp. sativus TaxID=79200 RepID=A0A175YAU1_DAUCS|nr:hypothetical protein DCAR_0311580 [Daucus carota subsp. sativus]